MSVPVEPNVATPTVNATANQMLPLEPMDAQITSIQPGDAYIVHLELAWGRVRRWWLRTFRPGYLERMRRTRNGEENRCPHEVLDPRDVKFYRNQGGYWWDQADDPFAWREKIPFARVGLAELLISCLICFGGAALLAMPLVEKPLTEITIMGWLLVAALVVIGGLIVWFFRDPTRVIPTEVGTIVAPADGKIVTIERIEYDEFVGGPAVLVGIFLSIFNVHINRAPLAARVIGLTYTRGKFLNALKPQSVRENERLEVRLQSTQWPQYRMRLRQISGAIARRIVCWLKPGDDLAAGEQFGMIKFGSRTELILPDVPELNLTTQVGDKVQAGSSVLGRFETSRPPAAG
jgi:phosphatidylserine decarboxylase